MQEENVLLQHEAWQINPSPPPTHVLPIHTWKTKKGGGGQSQWCLDLTLQNRFLDDSTVVTMYIEAASGHSK